MGLVKSDDGTVVAEYEYSPAGVMLKAAGPLAKANTFRFSTKPTDDETGVVPFHLRDYDPDLQRWLSRDLIDENGGGNLYCFAQNNSISLVDAHGLAVSGFSPQTGPVTLSLVNNVMYAPGTSLRMAGEYHHERFEVPLSVDVSVSRFASEIEVFDIELKIRRPNASRDAWNKAVQFDGGYAPAIGWAKPTWVDGWAYGDFAYWARKSDLTEDYAIEATAKEDTGMNGHIGSWVGPSEWGPEASGYWYTHAWRPYHKEDTGQLINEITAPVLSVGLDNGPRGCMKGKVLLRLLPNSAEYSGGRVAGPITVEWPGDHGENKPTITITSSDTVPSQIVEDLHPIYGLLTLKEHGWLK